jgi:ribosomal protein S15P/S13E
VITKHIVRMLVESQRLAIEAPAADHQQAMAMLERAANLAEHAAAELRSEVQESLGWPPV